MIVSFNNVSKATKRLERYILSNLIHLYSARDPLLDILYHNKHVKSKIHKFDR